METLVYREMSYLNYGGRLWLERRIHSSSIQATAQVLYLPLYRYDV